MIRMVCIFRSYRSSEAPESLSSTMANQRRDEESIFIERKRIK